MRVGIIATHAFPLPNPNLYESALADTLHTGDIVISGLIKNLAELGYEIYVFAPEGSYYPPNGKLFVMDSSRGNSSPTAIECEKKCFDEYKKEILSCDIIHDFSIVKIITGMLALNYKHKPQISTIMGGPWMQPFTPVNLTVWSDSHKYRVQNGFSDYHNTKLDGQNGNPVNDVSVVNGGIDTSFYTPTYVKDNYFLFIGRWHEVRGYKLAIEIAKKTGINLIMAGEHPDNEKFDYQRNCALEAVELAKNYSNIKFEWLPKEDPGHHLVKRKLYQGAKAFINPIQFNEPFGLSMPESLACGTPVIVTNYGSAPEIIKNNITGFTVDNDIDAFIEAINKINSINPINCRIDSVNRFDLKIMALNYIEKYDEIISKQNVITKEVKQETKVTEENNISQKGPVAITKEQSFKGKSFQVVKGVTHPEYSFNTFDQEEFNFRNKYWNIKQDDIVFDIGTSYGSYTLTALSQGATVYSFEPEKTVFDGLIDNININNWQDKSFPANMGFWSSITYLDMKSYAPHWPEATISGDYFMHTIDEYVKSIKLNKIDWMKIDVEGAEVEVIKGGLKTLKSLKPNLIIECHDFLDNTLSKQVRELLEPYYNFEEIEREPCIMLYCTKKGQT